MRKEREKKKRKKEEPLCQQKERIFTGEDKLTK